LQPIHAGEATGQRARAEPRREVGAHLHRRAELDHPQHRLDTLLPLHDALAIDRGGTAVSDSFLVAVVVVLAAERQLSGAESRDLQDCSGSVAPVRHYDKLTLEPLSAAIDVRFLKVFFRDFGPACVTWTGVRCTSALVIASVG
jgi:hypothetical protein